MVVMELAAIAITTGSSNSHVKPGRIHQLGVCREPCWQLRTGHAIATSFGPLELEGLSPEPRPWADLESRSLLRVPRKV